MKKDDYESFRNFMNMFHHEFQEQTNVKLLIAFLRKKGDKFDVFDSSKEHLKYLIEAKDAVF